MPFYHKSRNLLTSLWFELALFPDLANHRIDQFFNEWITDRIDPSRFLDFRRNNPIALEYGKMLRYNRLWLFEAAPYVTDTWYFLMRDEAENLEADRMAYRLVFLSIGNEICFFTGFRFLIHNADIIYSKMQ